LANQVFFYDNPVRFTDSVNKICDELEKRIAEKNGVFPEKMPRILISGCPQAVPNWKLPFIVETSGAVIVGEGSCVGERGSRNLTDAKLLLGSQLGNSIFLAILDNVPHSRYIHKNSNGGKPWAKHPQSELELNPI
jgi:hypothetical protein